MTKLILLTPQGNVIYSCTICHKTMTKEQSIITIVDKSKIITYHYTCKVKS